MGTVWLSRRKRVIRGAKGSGFVTLEYEMPDISIEMPAEGQVAAEAAEAVKGWLVMNLRAGRDAEGTSHTIADRTHEIRQADREPPRNPYGRRLRAGTYRSQVVPGAVASLKTGRQVKARSGSRWSSRYPGGRGSQGGSTAFSDSGYLAGNVSVRVAGKSAFVEVPSARVAAVLAIETGRYAGAKGPVPLFGVTDKPMEDATQRVMGRVASSLQSGISGALQGVLGRGLGGLAAMALFSGGE